MTAKDPEIEKFLAHSIEQYNKILLHSDRLIGMLDALDYSNVGQYAMELEEMQNRARINDKALMVEIDKNPQEWGSNGLFLKRLEIIQTILERNSMLLPRLQAVLAVVKAERDSFREGRAAVAGYNSLNIPQSIESRTA